MKIHFKNISYLAVAICALIYIETNSKEIPTDTLDYLGFQKGINPVLIDQESLSPREIKNQSIYNSSENCKNCHKQIYTNWYSSRHRQSHSNKFYQFSLSKEPMPWCENCHAPLRDSAKGTMLHPEQGISCITCHVRNQQIIVAKLPDSKEKYSHNYKVIQNFNTEKLCESCHDFNFPTWKSIVSKISTIEYSKTSMQGTVSEWRASGFNQESDCVDCHLEPGSKNSHKFLGGHSLEELKKSFAVSSRYISGNVLQISIDSIRIGHAFPTGDLFRALKLNIYSKDGRFLKQFVMSKKYRLTKKEERLTNDSPKLLDEDTRIPAPEKGKDSSRKDFLFNIENFPKSIQVELWIDYLNDIDFLIAPITDSQSKKLILREEIEIENRDSFDENDRG